MKSKSQVMKQIITGKIITAAAGIGGVEAVDMILSQAGPDVDWIKAITQLLIAIAAIVSLMKKKKKE